MIENLIKVKKMGYEVKNTLEKGDFDNFGEIMNRHWFEKKKRYNEMTNFFIESLYDGALKNGAIGGKLLGAGGGGYFIFFVSHAKKLALIEHLNRNGLHPRPFRFESKGLQSWKVREQKT